ncbi:MAG: MFS transporter [Clostridia bacterium]|nr:MFS transporter [Clostridia bacterium]
MAEQHGKIKAFLGDVKEHWKTPAPGKYVPYREYLSIFGAVGGDYTLKYLCGLLSFGTGCYLVAYYYQIPLLTFAAINTFFIATRYLWDILSMGVDANLGFLPKKVERRYFAVYLSFAALGLLMMIFNFASLLPVNAQRFLNSRWPGIDAVNIFKIFGVYFFCNGWGGFRGIVIRKLLLRKLGRYKLFAYANIVQGVIVAVLICWLPLYELPMTERVWKLYLLFQLYTMFTFTGFTEKVALNISPNQSERLIVNAYPVKISHIVQNIVAFIVPAAAGALFAEGIKDVNTFRYLLPGFFVLSALIMFIGLGKIKERIPAPPIEKKEYYSFWTCIGGIFKNKYLWISSAVSLLDSLGNGMLPMKNILLIYTWRETGLIFSVAELVLKFAGTPGQFLAPWIRKRFQYKTLMVFSQIVNAARSVVYILAFLFLGDHYWLCGILLFITIFVGDALTSALKIASTDMSVRVSDYQMYISGERFEGYQGIIGWFTSPIIALVSLIIPLMFVSVGFTSDWDVLYLDSVRIKCMIIGIAFDLVGYILMMIPYIFFWDFTDEKHTEIMKELQERADRAAEGPGNGEPVAETVSSGTAIPAPTQ